MNAMRTSPNHMIEDDAGGASDSDSNADDSPEYYQPISAEANDGELEFSYGENSNSGDDEDDHQLNPHNSLPNGYASCVENGVSTPNLSDEKDEEEERMREESDMAVQRAFREDESRRNASLTPGNSMRVIEAMHGVSFGGVAPAWASEIPEDQWINQLRRLRRLSPASYTIKD